MREKYDFPPFEERFLDSSETHSYEQEYAVFHARFVFFHQTLNQKILNLTFLILQKGMPSLQSRLRKFYFAIFS